LSPELPGPRSTGPRNIVGRVIAAIATLAALVVGLMVSAVVFAVALLVGLVVWGWLWWKMRRVMRQAQQDPRFQQFRDFQAGGAQPPPGSNADVIEGEVLHGEWKDEKRR
jgi:Flp pilus assembly protein TadB